MGGRLAKIILTLWLSLFSFSIQSMDEVKEISKIIDLAYKECSTYELLSDRLLCFRKSKSKHRDFLKKIMNKLKSEKKELSEVYKLEKELIGLLNRSY